MSKSQRSLRALTYLRVSTVEQADTDIDPEGYSIPAQREACLRKALELDAEVVEEYCDRGASAKSTDRPALQKMLERLKERDIDLVIVHKVDRLARSRADDVTINIAIRQAGATLVSVSENIDETPSGKLLHGIMATMAEFYSSNLATEAAKGMGQKAKKGGTPGRAPLGYRNVREEVDGREIRSIAVDEERAADIKWAFKKYATGDYTIAQLREELAERGFRSPPTPNTPSKVPSISRIAKMLGNRYYLGVVPYKGQEYVGRHEALIDQKTFDRVQAIKQGRLIAGVKNRKYEHYLKGSLRCGHCGGRMSFIHATGKQGGKYDYFYCLQRSKRSGCTQPYVPVALIEDEIEAYWKTVQLAPAYADRVRELLLEELDLLQRYEHIELERAEKAVAKVEKRRKRLGDRVLDGSIPPDVGRQQQKELAVELRNAENIRDRCEVGFRDMAGVLTQAIEKTKNCGRGYADAITPIRREWNRSFFEWFEITGARVTAARTRGEFELLLQPQLDERLISELELIRKTENPEALYERRGSNKLTLVGAEGFEPPTPSL